MKTIVFLDIDGVFNTVRLSSMFDRIDFSIIKAFKEEIFNCGASIVWMNSRRILYGNNRCDLKQMLKFYGLQILEKHTHQYWRTPIISTDSRIRGDEVSAWCREHQDAVDTYFCIDDNSDFYPHDNLLQIDASTGMTMADISLMQLYLGALLLPTASYPVNKHDLFSVKRVLRNTKTLRNLYDRFLVEQ